ncbi:MAG: ABC transporter substrate-binding protein [Anaerolineales bacterium]
MKSKAIYILLALSIALAACSGGAAKTPAAPAETNAPAAPAATEAPAAPKDYLYIGWLGIPDTLNPAYAFLTESYTVFDLIYSTLVTESTDGAYVGDLAKDWSVSEDGLTWTYHLKDGIKWHNGEDFTADQMAWAINAVIENPDGWAASSGYVGGFVNASAPDAKTVVITTEYPVANMDYRLSFMYAVYPPDFESFASVEDLQNFLNFEPVGTGPFKVQKFDKDAGVLILDSFADYMDGAPEYAGVVFQTFDNADAMIQALKAGEIDLVNEVPASAFQTVQKFENVKATASNGRYFNELIINSVDPNNDPAPTGNPALQDPAVRLAIAHVINKQDIVDVVLQGLAEPGDSIIPPTLGGGFWKSANIKDVPFDVQEANRILDESGYVLGADGVRTKGDLRLEFRLQFPSDNSSYPRIADMMADWFSQAGMKATPEAVDPDSLVAATTPAGDYDLVIWGWGPDPDPDFILSVMTTEQFVDGGWSDSGYHNPAYDQLYLDQQQSVDKTERQKIVWQMQEMVFNDRPYVVLYYEKLLQAYRTDRFSSFIESPLGIEARESLMRVKPVQ